MDKSLRELNCEGLDLIHHDPLEFARSSSRWTKRVKIQALDRTQPGLPDEAGTCWHDDPRLQTSRHDRTVGCPQHPRRRLIGRDIRSAIATRSSSAIPIKISLGVFQLSSEGWLKPFCVAWAMTSDCLIIPEQ